jgi:DNA-binding CsgD family transcriptional regulator
MLSTTALDRRRIADIRQAIARAGDGSQPVLVSIVPALREIFQADAASAIGLTRDGSDVLRLAHVYSVGVETAIAEQDLTRLLREHPSDLGLSWDPSYAEAGQRDLVLTLGQLQSLYGDRATGNAGVKRVLMKWGLDKADWLRALICDRTAPISRIGIFRDMEFSQSEAAQLQLLVPALKDRLVLERHFGSTGYQGAALDLALANFPGESMVVRLAARSLSIEHANPRAEAALAADGPRFREQIRASIQGTNGPYRSVELPGTSGVTARYFLLTRRPEMARLSSNLEVLEERWELTPKQSRVLALVARGLSNKSIAAELQCAENTVEFHVTGLLGITKAENRTQLVAKFWTESTE